MSKEKLIKQITTVLEEYGMPEFRDETPAMDVLQIIKDAGYTRQHDKELIEVLELAERYVYNAPLEGALDAYKKIVKTLSKVKGE